MKQPNLFDPCAVVAALATFAFTGCSRVDSSPSTNNLPPAFTNSAMTNFAKPSPAELKQKLTPMQFEVTQNAATEPPFRNEFWNNHKPGLYVDIVSGKPL